MADSRPRIKQTGKPLNLDQLSVELGGKALCASSTEIVAAEGTTITVAELQAAYNAHVADPNFGVPSEDNELVGMRSKAQGVMAGSDMFTPPQVQKIMAGLLLRATR